MSGQFCGPQPGAYGSTRYSSVSKVSREGEVGIEHITLSLIGGRVISVQHSRVVVETPLQRLYAWWWGKRGHTKPETNRKKGTRKKSAPVWSPSTIELPPTNCYM